MSEELKEKYQKRNASFKKTLVFRTGIDAGFFTEYTYLVNAMLYCLQSQIRFKLYSNDANFGHDRGWTDYFLPFCDEICDSFHSRFNTHRTPSLKRIWGGGKTQRLRMTKWNIKVHAKHIIGRLYALIKYKTVTQFNQDITLNYNKININFPELNLNSDYLNDYRRMVDITWKLNARTKEESDSLIEGLKLPHKYIACQIRGGDKITETALINPEMYVRFIRETTDIKDVFVLTDDYSIFCSLQTLAPDLRWYTLCTPKEAGYVNSSFTHASSTQKRNQMVRLFTSVQLMMDSALFIGSITTGPSRFIMKLRYPDVVAIDCPLEKIPKMLTENITSIVSQKLVE